MGRKTKLTPELIKNADKLLKAGNYNLTVCEYLNIHPSTWYKWMQDGEKARNGIKKEFFDTVKRAEAEAEVRLLTDLQKIAKEQNSWQGIAWMLERKYPERWGRKEKVAADLNHSGEVVNRHEQNHNINIKQEVKHSLREYDDVIDELLHERRERDTANISNDSTNDTE